MKTVSKALTGAVAAGALAVSATPAMAEHRDGGISTGDVIAGAVILGGIAAVISASNRDRNDYRNSNYRYRDSNYRDRDYRGDRWQRRGNPRNAVERCVNAAEREARRYGYRFADVTQIRDVDDTRYGWRVKGNIVVDGARGYRGYDRRGWNQRGYDQARFTCHVGGGRGAQVDFSGLRGYR